MAPQEPQPERLRRLWSEARYGDVLEEVAGTFGFTLPWDAELPTADAVASVAAPDVQDSSGVARSGAVTALARPVDLGDEYAIDLARLGAECCNRLAEGHLANRDWRRAAACCAACASLCEGGAACRGRWRGESFEPDAEAWAAVRYGRLWHAAEAARLAGREACGAGGGGGGGSGGSSSRAHLEASRRCLRACQEVLFRWPGSTKNPESLRTCLAETSWRLGDLAAARAECREALAILEKRGSSKAYATVFALWIFANVAFEEQSWSEVRAAVRSAQESVARLEASGHHGERSRAHRQLLHKMTRLARGVVPPSPSDQILPLGPGRSEWPADGQRPGDLPKDVADGPTAAEPCEVGPGESGLLADLRRALEESPRPRDKARLPPRLSHEGSLHDLDGSDIISAFLGSGQRGHGPDFSERDRCRAASPKREAPRPAALPPVLSASPRPGVPEGAARSGPAAPSISPRPSALWPLAPAERPLDTTMVGRMDGLSSPLARASRPGSAPPGRAAQLGRLAQPAPGPVQGAVLEVSLYLEGVSVGAGIRCEDPLLCRGSLRPRGAESPERADGWELGLRSSAGRGPDYRAPAYPSGWSASHPQLEDELEVDWDATLSITERDAPSAHRESRRGSDLLVDDSVFLSDCEGAEPPSDAARLRSWAPDDAEDPGFLAGMPTFGLHTHAAGARPASPGRASIAAAAKIAATKMASADLPSATAAAATRGAYPEDTTDRSEKRIRVETTDPLHWVLDPPEGAAAAQATRAQAAAAAPSRGIVGYICQLTPPPTRLCTTLAAPPVDASGESPVRPTPAAPGPGTAYGSATGPSPRRPASASARGRQSPAQDRVGPRAACDRPEPAPLSKPPPGRAASPLAARARSASASGEPRPRSPDEPPDPRGAPAASLPPPARRTSLPPSLAGRAPAVPVPRARAASGAAPPVPRAPWGAGKHANSKVAANIRSQRLLREASRRHAEQLELAGAMAAVFGH